MPVLDADTRINLLACSGLMSILPVPSDDEVFGAYVVWLYSYIGFLGATQWKVSGIPWISFADYNFVTFEYQVGDNNFNDVDYFIYNRMLMFTDLALEDIYALTPIQYQRWCSLAEGGGWYVLMYPAGFN